MNLNQASYPVRSLTFEIPHDVNQIKPLIHVAARYIRLHNLQIISFVRQASYLIIGIALIWAESAEFVKCFPQHFFNLRFHVDLFLTNV